MKLYIQAQTFRDTWNKKINRSVYRSKNIINVAGASSSMEKNMNSDFDLFCMVFMKHTKLIDQIIEWLNQNNYENTVNYHCNPDMVPFFELVVTYHH